MNRREKLILNTMNDVQDTQEAAYLHTTMKIVLADMGQQFFKFWKARGPGVLFMQPG